MFIGLKQYQKERKEKKNKRVEVTRIGHGQHSIVKVCCLDYSKNVTYQETYLATSTTLDDPRSEIVQQILNDIKRIKANNRNIKIDEMAIYTEDDFGECHPFFDMDDCEVVLFNE